MKRIVCLLLFLVCFFSFAFSAFAAETIPGKSKMLESGAMLLYDSYAKHGEYIYTYNLDDLFVDGEVKFVEDKYRIIPEDYKYATISGTMLKITTEKDIMNDSLKIVAVDRYGKETTLPCKLKFIYSPRYIADLFTVFLFAFTLILILLLSFTLLFRPVRGSISSLVIKDGEIAETVNHPGFLGMVFLSKKKCHGIKGFFIGKSHNCVKLIIRSVPKNNKGTVFMKTENTDGSINVKELCAVKIPANETYRFFTDKSCKNGFEITYIPR